MGGVTSNASFAEPATGRAGLASPRSSLAPLPPARDAGGYRHARRHQIELVHVFWERKMSARCLSWWLLGLQSSRRSIRFALLLLSTTIFAQWPYARGEDPKSDVPTVDQHREKLLEEMRRRAEGLKVAVLVDHEKVPAEAVAEPLLRFSDPLRGLRDATMWCWCYKGRPVALFKTQIGGGDDQKWTWLDGLNSLSSELIEVEWADGHQFASRKKGLKMNAIPEGPEPGAKARQRLQQMKDVARRFEVTIWPSEGNQQEMRLLPRPLHQFSAPDDGLTDGALFGFTSNGTNPDAVLAIELMRGEAAARQWQYGLTQMTTGGLSVRWDDREVWSATQKTITPTAFDEWTWFWAPEPSVAAIVAELPLPSHRPEQHAASVA